MAEMSGQEQVTKVDRPERPTSPPGPPGVQRCPSCEHLPKFHQPEGCWYTVVTGHLNENLVCPCAVPWKVRTPEPDVTVARTKGRPDYASAVHDAHERFEQEGRADGQ